MADIHLVSWASRKYSASYAFWSKQGAESNCLLMCGFGPNVAEFETKEQAEEALTKLFNKFDDSQVTYWLMDMIPSIVTISETVFSPPIISNA